MIVYSAYPWGLHDPDFIVTYGILLLILVAVIVILTAKIMRLEARIDLLELRSPR